MEANTIIEALWQPGSGTLNPHVFALLDGARDPRIAPMVRGSGLDYACLYAGRLSPELQAVAPYVVHLTPEAKFTRDLVTLGWGQNWGIFALGPGDIAVESQRRHFRTLLRVRTETGRILIFRFYDPRVFRVYLPTCNDDETRQVFGRNTAFMAENEDACGLMRYRRIGNGVTARAVEMAKPASQPDARA